MKKSILAMALMFIIAATAFAAETIWSRLFFEPTQEDYDCCHVEVQGQYHNYLDAKGAGDYTEAVRLSLFYWTRGWLHFNEAMRHVNIGWNDPDKIESALPFFDLAVKDATSANNKEGKVILALVEKNRALAVKQAEALRSKRDKSRK